MWRTLKVYAKKRGTKYRSHGDGKMLIIRCKCLMLNQVLCLIRLKSGNCAYHSIANHFLYGGIPTTTRLEQAWREAPKLSPEEQDAFADCVLAELRSEEKWNRLFANSQEALSKLASEALVEHHRGQTRELNPDQL